MIQSPNFSLENKLAIITGGGTGIGFGIARTFVNAGARVIIIGRRLEVLEDAVEKLGSNAYCLQFDVTKSENIPALIEHIESEYGPVQILVNNAGKHLKKWAQDTTVTEFNEIIQNNVISAFSLTIACAAHMMKRQSGSILMISSMTAFFGMEKVVAYGTSKSALTGLINGLVTEYSKYNIRVNGIAPGWITSDIFFKAIESDDVRRRKIVNRIAMDGFGSAEDIGYAAQYLCSDAARYVTGVILPVDGGALVNI